MPRWLYFVCDIVAIGLLGFAVYFPRYRRRDLLAAYVAVNVGVMAVVVALTSSITGVGIGVGFGLFGVLSIVRLRSDELAQQELAYYFVALALGLLGGLEISPWWVVPTLSAVIVAAAVVGDHPRLFGAHRHQKMTLDRAFTDEVALRTHLEQLLGADVKHLLVTRTDLVNDTTAVDVRYRLRPRTAGHRSSANGSAPAQTRLPERPRTGPAPRPPGTPVRPVPAPAAAPVRTGQQALATPPAPSSRVPTKGNRL